MTGEVESLMGSKQPNLGAADALGRLIEPLGLTLDDTGGSVNFFGSDRCSRVVSGWARHSHSPRWLRRCARPRSGGKEQGRVRI
jgi:hypothetical protein